MELLYEGKSKQIYKTDSDDRVVVRFKDNISAFYNIKRAIIEHKGRLTCDISSMVLACTQDKARAGRVSSLPGERMSKGELANPWGAWGWPKGAQSSLLPGELS